MHCLSVYKDDPEALVNKTLSVQFSIESPLPGLPGVRAVHFHALTTHLTVLTEDAVVFSRKGREGRKQAYLRFAGL